MESQRAWIRHEIKYRVNRETFERFRDYTQNILEVDPNSAEQGGYFNYSIYYDSPDLQFLNEKEEGLEMRTKPRLRIYKDIKSDQALSSFFEFKHRRGSLVQKERVRIDRETSLKLLDPFHLEEAGENPVLNRITYFSRRYQIQPTICVLYKRQAFSCPLYPGLRITYDSHITASLNIGLDVPREEFLTVLPPNEAIIEIKYNQLRPNFIAPLIGKLELQQVSFSKYAESMRALYSTLRTR